MMLPTGYDYATESETNTPVAAQLHAIGREIDAELSYSTIARQGLARRAICSRGASRGISPRPTPTWARAIRYSLGF